MMRLTATALQRCAKGGPDCPCAGCRKRRVQRRATTADAGASYAPPSVHGVLASAGRPLEPQVRSAMEARLGHDFSRVRVHDDASAARSAADVSAHAYTVGAHVVFGAGAYAPQTHAGGDLLAHELAHVIQQEGAAAGGPLRIMAAQDTAEYAADALARGADSAARVTRAAVQRRAVDDAFHLPCRDTRPGSFATVQRAEADAIRMLEATATAIDLRLALHPLADAVGESPGLLAFRDALWRNFHLDYNRASVRAQWLPLLARRYRLVAGWIGRLRHRYDCAAAGAEPPGPCRDQPGQGNAWTASGINNTDLCDGFWGRGDADLARTLLHEWFHFGFEWLGDCEATNRNNTECYEAFAAEVGGAVPTGSSAWCCVPPADPLPAFAGGGAGP